MDQIKHIPLFHIPGTMHLSPVSHKDSLYHQNIRQKSAYRTADLFHMRKDPGQIPGFSHSRVASGIIGHPQNHLLMRPLEKFHNLRNMQKRGFRKVAAPKRSDVNQNQRKSLFPAYIIQPDFFFHRASVRRRLCPERIDMIPSAARI